MIADEKEKQRQLRKKTKKIKKTLQSEMNAMQEEIEGQNQQR